MGQKFRITRHRFNGGEVSPEVALARSDMEFYSKGCQTLENFIPLLRGGVMRRPGFERYSDWIDPAANYANGTHRVLRFFYNLNEEYSVILRRVAEDVVSIFIDKLYGEEDQVLLSDIGFYETADFNDIQYFQSGDVLFLFHPKTPTLRIERHAEDDWRVVEHNYRAGPMETINVDRSSTISLTVPEYDNAAQTPRSAGEVVMSVNSSVTDITALAYVFWYQGPYTYTGSSWRYHTAYYKLRISIDDSSFFTAGSQVYLSGMTGSAHDWDGWHEVVGVGTGYVEINDGASVKYMYTRPYPYTGEWQLWGTQNDTRPALTGVPEAAATAGTTTQTGNAFYMALHDDVTDADALPVYPATETEDWRLMSSTIGSVSATSSAGIFKTSDVGRKIMLQRGAAETDKGTFTATGDLSNALPASESVTLTTEGGVWGGRIDLQESVDGGQTWETIGTIEADEGNYNGSITREVTSLITLVRAKMSFYQEWDNGNGDTDDGCTWRIEPEGLESIYGTISEYLSANSVTVALETPMVRNQTGYQWALGAFGGSNGYPACGCIHEEGLVVAGVPGHPAWWYRSRLNDWDRFDEGTLATAGLKFMLPSSAAERGLWVASKSDVLLLGTQIAEWKIWGPSSDSSISFENIKMKRLSSFGSAQVQPVFVEDAIIFCSADRRTLRALRYTYESDEITATEILDIMADHLPLAELVAMDVDAKRSIIWTLDAAGGLCSVTYDSVNKVLAWARHTLPMPSTREEEISSLVCFTDHLVVVFSVNDTEQNQLTIMDAAFGYPQYKPSTCVDDGEPTTNVDGLLRPTALTQSEEGLNGANAYKMSDLDLYLLESRGGQVSVDGGKKWIDITYPDPNEAFTGRVRIRIPSMTTEDPDVQVRTTGPFAFTLLALAVTIERTNSEVL